MSNGLSSSTRRLIKGAAVLMPDEWYLTLSHRRSIGRFPQMKRPTTFNEIILTRCLRPDPRWTTLTDKLSVRQYVMERIGEQYLIPLLAAPDVFTKEVFDSLPSSFVMKASHGSGFVEVVRDKSKRSFEELRRLADRWLRVNYYRVGRERHYRGIPPRILFEALLLDRSGNVPADYEMNMFGYAPHGPVIYTGVVSSRFDGRGKPLADMYDAEWNRLDVARGTYGRSERGVARPSNWDELSRIAIRLAEGLGYVRVDLYVLDEQIFFGELTFTPGGGTMPYIPDHCDYEWGRILKGANYCAAPV
ncbi:ATP-grasp fold amidoligase family protein [Paraburkholderia mimosarum]|uniref:ATP-grasp fold amidoligase family protein n=1 Tax=Paraburkholderia mimosarum TaxID=312026 RepID=UPI0005A8A038|nr:ATP-grasp fold amidoligase family protein [Paraburkholderia mimosarum]